LTTSFRAPFQVLKRNLGYWANGLYKPDDSQGLLITVMATIQMPSPGDMMQIEATAWGKRAARYIKIYTDTRLGVVNQETEGHDRYPGDLVYYDNGKYLVFGEVDFTMLLRTRTTTVSHWRYYACELIEQSALDGVQ
jgi:hypothetical protein